ncbi:hypothetical protein K3G39_11370 [Pontibacter sp. HSC-14F20]|uniref:hypothetical protein n=1 Tax=Pontibacter sp. HSC-14F20 TaxID=2864136 RepID=UPI001C739C93|nr:hypothetical protein [Pontibacter sp. HSC-14F20]MBX0333835.1 hypothetical protein [Pontibacter sp. HSC-14F20]
MKSKVLLGLGLCLSIFLTGCKDDDVGPANLQVKISSNSQTLVEGGDVVEVTVEMDRTYKELKYLYLDGAAMFMNREIRHDDGWITAEVDGKQRNLTRIPIPAGERTRTIQLRVDKDEVYQGNSAFEIKVYSYENGVVMPKAGLSIDYQDITPKPVFGLFKKNERDVTQTVNIAHLDNQGRFYLTVMADRAFTHPQKVTLAFSGTAAEGVHYDKEEQLVVNSRGSFQGNSYEVLRINKTSSFDPEKIIHIKLTAAEDGTIADGEEYIWPNPYGGEPFNMVNTYTLTITE